MVSNAIKTTGNEKATMESIVSFLRLVTGRGERQNKVVTIYLASTNWMGVLLDTDEEDHLVSIRTSQRKSHGTGTDARHGMITPLDKPRKVEGRDRSLYD